MNRTSRGDRWSMSAGRIQSRARWSEGTLATVIVLCVISPGTRSPSTREIESISHGTRSEPTFTTEWPIVACEVGEPSSTPVTTLIRSTRLLYAFMPPASSLLSGCGLHDLSTAREGDTGVAALTDHNRFNQGLIDVRRPVPANQKIGAGPTGRIRTLDHKLD